MPDDLEDDRSMVDGEREVNGELELEEEFAPLLPDNNHGNDRAATVEETSIVCESPAAGAKGVMFLQNFGTSGRSVYLEFMLLLISLGIAMLIRWLAIHLHDS